MAKLTEEEKAVLDKYLLGAITVKELRDSEIYAVLRKAVSGDAIPESVAAAINAPVDRAKNLWPVNMPKKQYTELSKAIAASIVNGDNPITTAPRLSMVTELTDQGEASLGKYAEYLTDTQPNLSDAQFQNLLDAKHRTLLNKRRKAIARTEQGQAQSEGSLLRAQGRGKKFKAWQTVGDSRVDDACMMNEAQGWIPIEQPFQSGKMQPLEHPNCRCAMSTRTREPNKIAQDRATLRARRTAEATSVL